MGNLGTLLRAKFAGAGFPTFSRALGAFWGRAVVLVGLARCDPHDVDRVADHVGGALLTFGTWSIRARFSC